MEQAPGILEMQQLEQAGFQPADIDQWRAETTGQLQDAGFNSEEVNEYFGEKTPDLSKVEQGFKANLQAKREAEKPAEGSSPKAVKPELLDPTKPNMKEADSFLEAIEAGFDMSVTGLLRERPDMVLPEHAPMFYRIASQVGTLAGDIPAMAAGAYSGMMAGAPIGGAIGTAVLPGVGTLGGIAVGSLVGAGAGGFALPEGMRTALMEHYEKGDVKSFADFWERTSAVAINTLKGGVIGGATIGAGAVAGKLAAGLSPTLKTTAQVASEVTTMTMIGAGLDGRVPEPHEFLDAAVLIGGIRGAVAVAGRTRAIYSKRGVRPAEIVEQIQTDPALKQKLLSENPPVEMLGELGRPEVNVADSSAKVQPDFKVTKPLREPNPDLSPEVNTILGKVSEKAERPKKELTTSQMYTAMVDKLDPINEVTKVLSSGKDIVAEQNPYILARVAVDYKSKARHMFEFGTIDYGTKKVTGKSLRSTLETVENIEVLEAYMISKRVVEKSKQGLNTGFDVKAAEAVVKEHGAKYEAAAKEITEFSNRVLNYVEQSGILSKEQAARMKAANKDYVPFKRVMDPAEAAAGKKGGGKGGSLKEFKGSERDIQSPVMSIVENTIELVRMAEVNRPKAALVKLASETPGQEIVRQIPDRMQGIKVTKEEIARAQAELPDASIEVLTDMVIFRKQQMDLAKNQFAVYEQGKRKVYETTPEVAEALARIGGDATATNIFFKLAAGITTVKKIGITFTPDFIIRNLERDTLTAAVFSKSKGINPMEIGRAMGDIWKESKTYQEWLTSGGAGGAFLDMGNRYVKTDIMKLQRETNFMNSVRNLVEKPIDFMRVAAALSEQSLRVAEFKKARAMGASLTESGFASREITIDFQRVGAKISALNSITAFMNVSIQGLDRTARAIKENPSAVLTKSAMYITTPSVLLWWANHNDERYKEIPQWQKDLYWIIPTDDWQEASAEEAGGLPEYMVREKNGKYEVNKGSIYRIPKPQELGLVFGTFPERILESYFNENPQAFKDFDKSMLALVTPSFVPDAVAPAIEQYFNKSFFTGREIIPHHLKDILPEYQFVEYTSETAKALGKMVATVDKQSDFASPMVLDNYARSWGGSLGAYAVQLADKALIASGVAPDTVDPTATLSDLPFIKAFVVRFPQAGSNSVQDFYTTYEEGQRVLKTIKHLAREGDFDSLEKEMTLAANQDKLVTLDGIKDALSAQSKFIRLVHKNPEITADEKRQMIDGAYLMMTEVAKQGNLLMLEVKKQLILGDADGN